MRRNIPLFVMFFFLSHPGMLSAQHLIVTEFMAAPASGEAEWVEIMNVSAETVNLREWTLQDRTAAPLAITSEDIYLLPDAFIVVSDQFPLGTRWQVAEQNVLLLPSLPALNNSGDDIVLRSPDGNVADQLVYTTAWLGPNGVSIERIRSDRGAEAENWSPSIAETGATPGLPNSVAPQMYDLALACAEMRDDSLIATVKNNGLRSPAAPVLEIWLVNSQSIAERLLGREAFFAPASGDSLTIRTRVTMEGNGRFPLLLLLQCEQDIRPDNDSLLLLLDIPLPKNTVILNEIMCEPSNGASEWLEYANTTSDYADLSGCRIAGALNASGIRSIIVLKEDLPPIPPFGYAVIAADSTILDAFPELLAPTASHVLIVCNRSSLGLGNSGDEVLLLDRNGGTIDSIAYSSEWHHPFLSSTKGRSLELLHPSLHLQGQDAWNSCTEASGGTPGRRNSISSDGMEIGATEDADLQISPLPFSPDGDGYEDFCVISCHAAPAVYQARLRLFDVNGRLIRTLMNNAPMGRRMALIWDGLDDQGRRARIGPYIILLEMLDTATNVVSAVKGIVVVATRL